MKRLLDDAWLCSCIDGSNGSGQVVCVDWWWFRVVWMADDWYVKTWHVVVFDSEEELFPLRYFFYFLIFWFSERRVNLRDVSETPCLLLRQNLTVNLYSVTFIYSLTIVKICTYRVLDFLTGLFWYHGMEIAVLIWFCSVSGRLET